MPDRGSATDVAVYLRELTVRLVAILVFAACVISLAAAVTWVVVKVSPAEKLAKPDEAP